MKGDAIEDDMPLLHTLNIESHICKFIQNLVYSAYLASIVGTEFDRNEDL